LSNNPILNSSTPTIKVLSPTQQSNSFENGPGPQFYTATPRSTESTKAALSIVPFNYQLKDTGDGWNNGTVYLAFENKTTQNIVFKAGNYLPFSTGVSCAPGAGVDFKISVETVEGPTYDTTLSVGGNATWINRPL